MDKILELCSITAGYNDNIILHNVNLAIYQRDFLGIIGPNGGGKSTLLKVIVGLIEPIRGTIRFCFASSNKKARRWIGYQPQINIFDVKFPILVIDVVLSGLLSQVGLFKRFSKEDRKKAQELMEQMGIARLENKSIGELSGGQMQRVFLCRALIASPKLLLLDEPSTFLDTNFDTNFYEILQELNKEIAIILVSHDLGIISSYVKNIACINGTLHYHSSNEINQEILAHYRCPVDIITHGELPHRVLREHSPK